MKIVWDEPKRRLNRESRGLDFADLDLDFFAGSLVVPAKRGRSMAIGRFCDQVISVVFMPLGKEAVAVISMRIASRKERSVL